MKTIRRLFYKEVINAVTFATIGFIALFFFFDFVDATHDNVDDEVLNVDGLFFVMVNDGGKR